MIVYFVFTRTSLYYFTRPQIAFWSSTLFLCSFDWILSTALRFYFDHLIRFMFNWFQFVTTFRFKSNNLLGLYVHFNLFFRPPSAWILVIYYVFTFIWFHSFNRSQIQFWSFASLLRSLDFIFSPASRPNFDHIFCFYVY